MGGLDVVFVSDGVNTRAFTLYKNVDFALDKTDTVDTHDEIITERDLVISGFNDDSSAEVNMKLVQVNTQRKIATVEDEKTVTFTSGEANSYSFNL